MSEEFLIRHCAPTLAGIKTGSIFPCPYDSKPAMIAELCFLNQRLVSKGLCVLPLRYAKDWVLIYVYRPIRLEADLSAAAARTLLAEVGYQNITTSQCVLELMRRLNQSEDFPHEIGLFLSYPPEDVRGFIENKGKGCKCVGYWKVYGDAKKAQATFAQYKRCTQHYFYQWAKGIAVERLAVAV